jgi:hypothetical protein
MGLQRRASRYDDVNLEYFPVVLVGHGIGVLNTVVATRNDFRHGVVVQLYDETLCESDDGIPLCKDRPELMTALVARIAGAILRE